MDRRIDALSKLSRRVAEQSDRTADPAATIEEAKQRALEDWAGSAHRGSSPAPARRLTAGERARSRAPLHLGLAAALVAASIAIVLFFLRPAPAASLSYVVGDEAAPGAVGAWIATNKKPLAVRFSEGTVLTLAADARARVTRADTIGASVLLERGSLRASVVHRDASTRWSLQAGPFEVQVTGTVLDIAWDPALDILDVTMIEGRVIIKGPLLEDGRALSTGERLHIEVREGRMSLTGAQPAVEKPAAPPQEGACTPPNCLPSPEDEPCSQPDCSAPGTPHRPRDATRASSASVSGGSRHDEGGAGAAINPGPSWRDLAAKGDHRAALDAIEKEGFASVIARSSTPDLLVLSDSARYAGDFQKAKSALLAARGRGARGRTAFLLGKIAADHLGALGDAMTWMQTYLSEEPGGGLAEQALGRIVELKKRAGDVEGARGAAETYLKRYPSGAYAPLSRTLVQP